MRKILGSDLLPNKRGQGGSHSFSLRPHTRGALDMMAKIFVGAVATQHTVAGVDPEQPDPGTYPGGT